MTTVALEHKTTFGTVMQNFAPGWFAAVMGTGALAITSFYFGHIFPLLAYWAWDCGGRAGGLLMVLQPAVPAWACSSWR